MPVKLPPSELRFIKETKLSGFCYTVSHYKGLIYVGRGMFYGRIDRINQLGQVDKGFIKLENVVNSLVAHRNRLYCLLRGKLSATLSVYGLDGRLLTSWKHPPYPHFGEQISVINNDQLALGDWKGKQIIIYSLTGDVIRRVPLPDCLTVKTTVCMSSCGDDSVVISDCDAGEVVRISLKDGSLIWCSDAFTKPYGVVHHPTGYILVSSGSRDHVVISVLDEADGMVY